MIFHSFPQPFIKSFYISPHSSCIFDFSDLRHWMSNKRAPNVTCCTETPSLSLFFIINDITVERNRVWSLVEVWSSSHSPYHGLFCIFVLYIITYYCVLIVINIFACLLELNRFHPNLNKNSTELESNKKQIIKKQTLTAPIKRQNIIVLI